MSLNIDTHSHAQPAATGAKKTVRFDLEKQQSKTTAASRKTFQQETLPSQHNIVSSEDFYTAKQGKFRIYDDIAGAESLRIEWKGSNLDRQEISDAAERLDHTHPLRNGDLSAELNHLDETLKKHTAKLSKLTKEYKDTQKRHDSEQDVYQKVLLEFKLGELKKTITHTHERVESISENLDHLKKYGKKLTPKSDLQLKIDTQENLLVDKIQEYRALREDLDFSYDIPAEFEINSIRKYHTRGFQELVSQVQRVGLEINVFSERLEILREQHFQLFGKEAPIFGQNHR